MRTTTHRYFLLSTAVMLLLQSSLLLADAAATTNPNQITLSAWTYGKGCANLTGKWEGQVYDSSEIYGHTNLGLATMHLLYKNSRLQGDITFNNPQLRSGQFSAYCHQGTINHLIYPNHYASPQVCGGYSEPSALLSPHLLFLRLHWEIAMTGGNFFIMADKKEGSLSNKEKNALRSQHIPTNIQSCH